jgi:hypothetical protein
MNELQITVLGEVRLIVNGEPAELQPMEQGVLAALVINRNRNLTTDELRNWVWNDPHSISNNQVRSYLTTLRTLVGEERLPLRRRQLVLSDTRVDLDRLFRPSIGGDEHQRLDDVSSRIALCAPPFLNGVERTPLFAAEITKWATQLTQLRAERLRLQLRTGMAEEVFPTLQANLENSPMDLMALRSYVEATVMLGRTNLAAEAFDHFRIATLTSGYPLPDAFTRLHQEFLSGQIDMPINEQRTSLPSSLPVVQNVIGRTVERQQLNDWLRQPARHGPVGVICGESGTGKSFLVNAWLTRVSIVSIRRSSCTAEESQGRPLLRLFGQPDKGVLRTPEGVLDEVSQYLNTPEPEILFLDDIHWADPITLRTIELLTTTLPPHKHLLLAGRPGDVLRELRRRRVELWIEPASFTSQEIAETFTVELGRSPTLDEVAHVRRATGGLPLLVVETVRAIRRTNALFNLVGPDAVHLEYLVEQLQWNLKSEVRHALAVASMLGNEIDVEVLSRVLHTTPYSTLERLDAAVDSRILVFHDGYQFRHALFREGVQSLLSPGKQAHLHLAIADALKDRWPWRAAEHLLLGAGLVNGDELRERVTAAATSAEAAHEVEAAARLYEGLMLHLHRSSTLSSHERVELHLRAAVALERSGFVTRGTEHRLSALAEAERRQQATWAINSVKQPPGNGRSARPDPLRVAMIRRAEVLAEHAQLFGAERLELEAERFTVEVLSGVLTETEITTGMHRMDAAVNDPDLGQPTKAVCARASNTAALVLHEWSRDRLEDLLKHALGTGDIDLISDAYALSLHAACSDGDRARFEALRPVAEGFCNGSGRPVDRAGVAALIAVFSELTGDLQQMVFWTTQTIEISRRYDIADAELLLSGRQIVWAWQGVDVTLNLSVPVVSGASDPPSIAPDSAIDAALGIVLNHLRGEAVTTQTLRDVCQHLVASSPHLVRVASAVMVSSIVVAHRDVVAAQLLSQLFEPLGNHFVIAGLTPVGCLGPIRLAQAELQIVQGNLGVAYRYLGEAELLCRLAGARVWLQQVQTRIETVVDLMPSLAQSNPAKPASLLKSSATDNISR